jgi:hypothetical protein
MPEVPEYIYNLLWSRRFDFGFFLNDGKCLPCVTWDYYEEVAFQSGRSNGAKSEESEESED